MNLHQQTNKQRRKSWLPPSNLLSSLLYPRQHRHETSSSKRRSQSLDQGESVTKTYYSAVSADPFNRSDEISSTRHLVPPPTPTPPPRRKKSSTLVSALFSKAKKNARLNRAATLIETTANYYKKSIKEVDKQRPHYCQHTNKHITTDDKNDGDDKEEPLMVSLFGVREDDVDRMQQKNDLIRLAFAGEFTRPIDEKTIEKVLDIGSGPLSWCIDFAKTHPNAQVIGMDYLNMVPPDIAMELPGNCQLLIHNCIKEFPYADNSIDLCHVRFMNVSLTMEQYCKMVSHCWRVLKPGGYLELMEMDMLVYNPGPVTELLNQQVIETVRTLGLKPRLARFLRDVLPSDSRLTDDLITEFYRSLPIGVWGGRLGVLFRDDLIYALTHARNISTTETQKQPSGGVTPSTSSLSSLSNNNSVKDFGVADISDDSSDAIFENQLLVAEKELEQCKSYSNFHFLRVQKPY